MKARSGGGGVSERNASEEPVRPLASQETLNGCVKDGSDEQGSESDGNQRVTGHVDETHAERDEENDEENGLSNETATVGKEKVEEELEGGMGEEGEQGRGARRVRTPVRVSVNEREP